MTISKEVMILVRKISFLGRSGTGKTILVSNLSAALVQLGYNVLQIGSDISLSSTELLREDKAITPVLDEFRDKFDIQIEDYVVDSPCGVYCLELGSIDPGAGCLARGLSTIDEMMHEQKLLDKYGIDFVIYDIAGDTPCTGYILPFREMRMDTVILVTNDRYASICTANSLLAALVRKSYSHPSVWLIENLTDQYSRYDLLDEFAQETGLTVIGRMDYEEVAEKASLGDETVVHLYPESEAAATFAELAKSIVACPLENENTPQPFGRECLLKWQRKWKLKRLAAMQRV